MDEVLIYTISDDHQTSEVIDWLNSFHIDSKRINTDTHPIDLNTSKISRNISSTSDKDEILGCWIRKPKQKHNFSLNLKELESGVNRGYGNKVCYDIYSSLEYEGKIYNDFLQTSVGAKNILGDYFKSDLNKLHVLDIAKKCNLIFPESLITNEKVELQLFKIQHEKIICKLNRVVFSSNEESDVVAQTFTEELTDKFIADLPDKFFCSFFQEKIEKQYEVRSFYLNGKFYSIAMFTQDQAETQTDFRKYNFAKPNRIVPYRLPEPIKEKLNLLMSEIDLNTGSLDLIKGIDGKYYFLEINPVGQFGFTAEGGNYQIAKDIALFLSKP